jgi:hypothetical protein
MDCTRLPLLRLGPKAVGSLTSAIRSASIFADLLQERRAAEMTGPQTDTCDSSEPHPGTSQHGSAQEVISSTLWDSRGKSTWALTSPLHV